jgi:hypothetical protein
MLRGCLAPRHVVPVARQAFPYVGHAQNLLAALGAQPVGQGTALFRESATFEWILHGLSLTFSAPAKALA